MTHSRYFATQEQLKGIKTIHMLNKIKKNMVHDLNSSVEGRFGNVTISETEKHDKIKYLNTVLMGEKTILPI